MISLGITTFNRPDCLRQSLRAVHYLLDVDMVVVHDDGSSSECRCEYDEIYDRYSYVSVQRGVNQGVAKSKNALLREMLDVGSDWLFLLEDDVEPISPMAVTGYVDACKASGFQHLSFAHHGPWKSAPVAIDGPISLYRPYIGAYSVYGREALEACGLFDENFYNTCEHVEHSVRLALAGYTDPRPFHAADATGSEEWLREIEAPSVIRDDPEWREHIKQAESYWRSAHPETWSFLFGESLTGVS